MSYETREIIYEEKKQKFVTNYCLKRLSLIVRVNVVLNRPVVVDSD